MQLNPQNPDVYQNLGFILLDAKKEEEAQDAFHEAEQLLRANGYNDAAEEMLRILAQITSHEPVKRRAYVNNSPRYLRLWQG